MTILGSAWMGKNEKRLLIHDGQKVLSVEQCYVFGSHLNDIIEFFMCFFNQKYYRVYNQYIYIHREQGQSYTKRNRNIYIY